MDLREIKIGLVVFDGFTDLDFYLPWDLFNRVRLMGLHQKWQVEILCDDRQVTSAAGLTLNSTKSYDFASGCDGLFFCSGPKTRELIRHESFLNRFALNSETQIFAAIDSGALILAALGLLRNKEATTYPTAFDLLKSLGTTVSRKPFVESGNIATGARCLSGDRLAIWMIEKLTSKQISEKVFESVKPLND